MGNLTGKQHLESLPMSHKLCDKKEVEEACQAPVLERLWYCVRCLAGGKRESQLFG